REAEPVLAAHLLAEPAALEVGARRLAARRLPEVALVERGRLLEQREQALAPAARGVLLRRRLLVLERDAEALGQPLHRLREVELFRLLHELDHVAARPAAEAVVELVRRVDGEARRLLVVERTEAGPPGARAPELGPRRDDLDHVGRGRGLA